jgi:hypothetical protein
LCALCLCLQMLPMHAALSLCIILPWLVRQRKINQLPAVHFRHGLGQGHARRSPARPLLAPADVNCTFFMLACLVFEVCVLVYTLHFASGWLLCSRPCPFLQKRKREG